MLIKDKFSLPILTVMLISIVNILFFLFIYLIISLLYYYLNISFDYLLLLVIVAFGVSLISYYSTKRFSLNNNIIQDKLNIEQQLKKALLCIYNLKVEIQAEISDRQIIEKAHIESENKLKTIINKAPNGIALLDKEGLILECNIALQNMLGYDEYELNGVFFVQAIHPQDIDLYKRKFRELIEGSSDIYRIKTRYIHKEFREVWGSLSVSVVRDAEGLPQFVIAMAEDITSKQLEEEETVNYQKQLQSFTSELSLIEEHERRRLSTNLHDDVGQVLTLIGIKIDELHEEVSLTAFSPLIEEIRKLIGSTLKCIRSLMFELSPPTLYDIGLEGTIEWLAEHFSKEHGLEIQISNDEQPKLINAEWTVILFQAIRELLYNIVKHAQATSVHIYIKRACNELCIVVSDDGNGFDINSYYNSLHRIKGFGLFGINERLNYYGGKMVIESDKVKGTSITLSIPMISTDKKEWYDILRKYGNPNSNSRVGEIEILKAD